MPKGRAGVLGLGRNEDMNVSKPQAVERLQQGTAALKAGDKEFARRCFSDAVHLDPANDSARLWLASVAESPLESLRHLEQVLQHNPTHEKALAAARAARVQAGVAAAKAKDLRLARSLLGQAVEEDPDCEKAWVWLASVLETPEEAITALENALTINPDNPRTQALLDSYRTSFTEREAEVPDTMPMPVKLSNEPPTILLVEDNAMVRKLLTFALEGHNCKVRSVADSEAAAADLRTNGIPDIFLLDVSLPGTDGIELCKLLRQESQTAYVPVILMAEQAGLMTGMRARMAGACATVTKSLELDGLLDAIDGARA